MKVLWLSWKDTLHPSSGGAELVMQELSKRLISEGHSVTILTAQYPGSSKTDTIDGIKIIRIGKNRYSHPIRGLFYYIRHLRNHYDAVVEVVNTASYMSPFFRGRARSVLVYHQLAREVWFYEASFPVNWVGYLILEPVAAFLLGKSNAKIITISRSTKNDLLRFGFKKNLINIISIGIELKPVKSLKSQRKFKQPTILCFGSMRAMKRSLDQVMAFEIAKTKIPKLQLKIAGDMTGAYGEKVKAYIEKSRYKADIESLGKVSKQEKVKLMQRSHVFVATSVKEGWGLVVTEAASQGTPAVVYDVDGLRDSVKNGKTGIIVGLNPESVSEGIVRLFMDRELYESMRRSAWNWSKSLTFDESYRQFKEVLVLT